MLRVFQECVGKLLAPTVYYMTRYYEILCNCERLDNYERQCMCTYNMSNS